MHDKQCFRKNRQYFRKIRQCFRRIKQCFSNARGYFTTKRQSLTTEQHHLAFFVPSQTLGAKVEVKQPTSTWQISLNHPPIVHFSHLYLLNMYDNSNGGKKPMGNNTNGPAIQCSSNHWCNTGVVNTVSITIWLKI